MRSAFKVLSLSISAPQMATILSASLAAVAATQGAGSICGSVTGSALVASTLCGSAPHSTTAIVAIDANLVTAAGTENVRKRNGISLLTTARRSACIVTNRCGIVAIRSDSVTAASLGAKSTTSAGRGRDRLAYRKSNSAYRLNHI